MADENDRSLGYREPRGENRSPPGTDRKIPGAAQEIRRQFRDAKQVITAKAPAGEPTQRRRKGREDRSGGFRLSSVRILRRVTENTRTPWDALRGTEHADDRKNEPSLLSAARANDGPMSAGELIAWHLQNGATMQALRAMFPGFFHGESAALETHRGPPDLHEPELWQWNRAPDTDNAFDDFQHTGQNDFQFHL